MTQRKIYVVGSAVGYVNWMQGTIVHTMEEADFIVFTGGEDVDPSLYKNQKHPQTRSNLDRDNLEKAAFRKAKALGKPCVGICRGSQLLCVLSGGELVQHQDNPLYRHDILTYDERVLPITSTHHQAQYPFNMAEDHYKILGWTEGLSRFHEDENQEEMFGGAITQECEIVLYPLTNCLGIQGHPESMYLRGDDQCETILYLQDLLTKFLNRELGNKQLRSHQELAV